MSDACIKTLVCELSHKIQENVYLQKHEELWMTQKGFGEYLFHLGSIRLDV